VRARKGEIVDVAFLAIIVAVLAVLLLKRKSKQLPYATYQTTIEPPLPSFEFKKAL
jgi:hypothetical protein